jgi:phosphoribosylformylglycinamidine (FGAM) synthase-like enzyme
VVSRISFSALDIQQFDDPTFESTFRTEFITTVASAAGVEPYRVTVDSITAGSVAVGFTVQFPLTATAAQTTFTNTLSTATSSVFASSTVMQSYGTVTAVVRWLCDAFRVVTPPRIVSLSCSYLVLTQRCSLITS